jgi:hypothetical protein
MLTRIGNGPREHDYTQNMWGHALYNLKMVEVTESPTSLWQKWFGPRVTSRVLQCLGLGSVRAGDTLLLRMASGMVGRFVVREIEHFSNPDDMFEINRADFLDYASQGPTGNERD